MIELCRYKYPTQCAVYIFTKPMSSTIKYFIYIELCCYKYRTQCRYKYRSQCVVYIFTTVTWLMGLHYLVEVELNDLYFQFFLNTQSFSVFLTIVSG